VVKYDINEPSFGAVFYMSRFKEFKDASLPISITAAIAVGTAAIFASGETGEENSANFSKISSESASAAVIVKDNENKVTEIDLDVINSNFQETLNWINSKNHPELKIFENDFDSYQQELKSNKFQKIDIIASGVAINDYASVLTSFSSSGFEVKIALSAIKFSDIKFNPQEAAIDLFQAQIIFDEAVKDPRKYSHDASYRHELQETAQKRAQEVFKNIVPRQSAVV